MRFSTLGDWLQWQQSLNPKSIDLGLERVAIVAARLQLNRPSVPVIIVAGTNGKGSTMAYLHAMYGAAGYRPGSYTSPHIFVYNERIRIGDDCATDEQIMAAFEAIDQARAELPLTYFEFGTLAALWLFAHQKVDVWLLEVGLGGRLDAVNLIDADACVLTNVSKDHQEFLGHEEFAIAREKAGVSRPDMPTVIASRQSSLRDAALVVGGHVIQLGSEYDLEDMGEGMRLSYQNEWFELPKPAMPGEFQLQNAAGACIAVQILQQRLPVSLECMTQGLCKARVMGRLDDRLGPRGWWFDVGHNEAAARQIGAFLASNSIKGRTLLVFSMLARKDAVPVVSALRESVDCWYVGPLSCDDAKPVSELSALMRSSDCRAKCFDVWADVVDDVLEEKRDEDRVIVFGSFITVEETVKVLSERSGNSLGQWSDG